MKLVSYNPHPALFAKAMATEKRGGEEEKEQWAFKKEVTAEEMHARSEELKRQKLEREAMEQRLLELFRDMRKHFAALPHKLDTGRPDPRAGRDADSTRPEFVAPAISEEEGAGGRDDRALVVADDNSTLESSSQAAASASHASSSTASSNKEGGEGGADGEIEQLSELGTARSAYSVASSAHTEGGGVKLLQKRAFFRLINKPESDWNQRAMAVKPLKAVLTLPEFEQAFFMHPVEEEDGHVSSAEVRRRQIPPRLLDGMGRVVPRCTHSMNNSLADYTD